MGARTQGCTSMCTRWADRGASSLQPGKPSANGWLDISCHLFVHMVFAPSSGVTYLGFEVFDGGSYPRLHFLVHSLLPYTHTYIHTYISPTPFGQMSDPLLRAVCSSRLHTYVHRARVFIARLCSRPEPHPLHTYIHTYIVML